MKYLSFSLLLCLISCTSLGQVNPFFAEADEFFETYVKDGLVDYSSLKKESGELEKMVNMIMSEPQMKGDAEKAFLINAYNILAIKMVVDNYPTEGPLKVEGFFDVAVFEVHGERVSLNGLEKKMLYPNYPDPLLHLVLVCAAKGCPKLASRAYNPEGLTAQLEEQARAVINDKEFTHLDEKTGQLKVSQIFEWYEKDFGGKDGVLAFVSRLYDGKVKDTKGFGYYEYGWSLNSK